MEDFYIFLNFRIFENKNKKNKINGYSGGPLRSILPGGPFRCSGGPLSFQNKEQQYHRTE